MNRNLLSFLKSKSWVAPSFMVVVALAGLIFQSRSQPESYRNFTDDERTVLSIVKSDPHAKIDNQDLILRIAKTTTTININHCFADPVVSKFTNGQTITFQNNDPVPHTIELTLAHSYLVPAHGRTAVKAEFGKDPSIWGCSCDGSKYVCGLFIEMPAGTNP